ncbi:MAG: outer membrane beta-barrel protein [Pseudodesulfovibrio sp.]|nr:outer membrane beta-barrel protein [Pseudodesulfovibrio sp.]
MVAPFILLSLVLLVPTLPSQAQTMDSSGGSGLSFSMYPGVNLPVGDGASVASPGLGGTIGAEYQFAQLPLFLGLDGYYGGSELSGLGVEEFTGSLSSFSAFAKAGVRLPLLPWLRFTVAGFVGGGYSMMETDSTAYGSSAAPGLGFGAAAGVELPINNSLSFGLKAGYLAHSNTYSGVTVQLGTTLALQGAGLSGKGSLAVDPVQFDTVFPVFYKYYDDNPVGTAVITNNNRKRLSNLAVTLMVPRFMDVQKTQTVPEGLGPGESLEVDLFALFTDDILGVTEGTKVAAKLDISYEIDGKPRSISLDRSLEIAHRNALTWDDDRKAASFVTAKDGTVLTLARNVAAVVRSSAFDSININVRTAVAMAEVLALYGVSYVIDPTSPYAELADQPQVVDFLQFPRQTLEYKAGDCDDLSILYAALLEAVGVPTALVTIPGHIYVAFSTGMKADEAHKLFSRPDEIIIRDDIAWVPVEITILKEGFLQAWQIGAKQWRENASRDQAKMYPLAEAWSLYPAVGLPDAESRIAVPSQSEILSVYQTQLVRFIDREIYAQVSRIQTQIASSNSDPRYINRLGVLYASYGLMDRARAEFNRIAQGNPPNVSALVNLGNLHFLGKELGPALEYYEKAQQLMPDNPVLLLALARTNHALENYGLVGRLYTQLKNIDPALAGQFAYLDFRGEDGQRASQASGLASLVVWDE